MIETHEVRNFSFGTIDTVEDKAIPDGAASASNNWLSMGDHIELRRGMALLGTEHTGPGGILGEHTGYKNDGTQLLWRKKGRKLEYFDEVTSDWLECGSNMFPAAAATDEASFGDYASLAGAQMFVCTPNAGPFKIVTANPGSFTDLTNPAKNFQGYIRIKQNRMWLWGRIKDLTGVYGSYIDAAAYTTVTAEAIGAMGTTHFAGTLAFKAAGTTRTSFAVTFTDTSETFTDNYDGTLTGSAGGSGTINYTTGAYDITFHAAAVGAVTATYQWEDSNSTGITDFSKDATRIAGQGFVFRQDDGGGAVMNILSYGDVEYCMHERKTWALTLTATDTNATNLIYRDNVGIPNRQAACETGNGIYYVDTSNETDPQIRLLTLSQYSTEVIPVAISKHIFHTKPNARGIKTAMTFGIDLSAYTFDKAVVFEWGNYIVTACYTNDAAANNTLIMFNKFLGSLERITLSASHLANYNGNLIGGDSISDNCYALFMNFDDDDSEINNSWEGALSELTTEELKKVKRLVMSGLISKDQSYDVYVETDNGGYALVDSISGTGSYVDQGQAISIGSTMVGEEKVGGGSSGTTAYYYQHPLRLSLDKFQRGKVKFVATGIGYVSIDNYEWFDIRPHGLKSPRKYR